MEPRLPIDPCPWDGNDDDDFDNEDSVQVWVSLEAKTKKGWVVLSIKDYRRGITLHTDVEVAQLKEGLDAAMASQGAENDDQKR